MHEYEAQQLASAEAYFADVLAAARLELMIMQDQMIMQGYTVTCYEGE